MCLRFLKGVPQKGTRSTKDFANTFVPFVLLCGALAGSLLMLGCAEHKPPTISSVAAAPAFTRPPGVLRVCADPNNLPFSNDRGEGFENKLAELLAHELGQRVEYTWWAQRRGVLRNTLRAGVCDVVLGVPQGFELALTTNPYYRSTYVFLYRKHSGLKIDSLDDPILKKLQIGVQIIGDDFSNAPPAHALGRRNIVGNVKGFTVYGDYSKANPPARIVDAVEKREVDVAIVWGPLAGYFAKQSKVAMEVVPVSPQIDQPFLPFVFDISKGVRRDDQELKDRLDEILEKRRIEIDRLLDDYRVPRVDREKGGAGV